MTAEELKTELEKVISGLTTSGFGSIDSGTVEKLDKFAAVAGELGIKQGKLLIENLSGVMKAIQEGKSKAESGSVRLTALDFYIQSLSGGGNVEVL
jgi:hypothetical protein